MKQKTIAVILITLAAAAAARGQAVTPWMAQFPSAEQVRQFVRGSNELDTAARQMGVFWQMRQLIYSLAYSERRTDRQFSPDEQRLAGEYYGGYSGLLAQMNAKVPPAGQKAWFEMHTRYESDRYLRDQIFQKFFTPQLRQAVYIALKEQMPSGPLPTAAPLTVPVDASVQKAKAAKVDTTVAGMQLGEPLRLPNCGIMLEAPSANCNLGNTAEAVQLFGIPIAQDKNADPELWRVRLSDDYSPDWLAGDVFVRIHDGVLVGVYLLTKGRNVERAVNAELKAKYGAPIGFYSGTITPDTGGAPFKYSNPEWMLAGLHVEYEVLMQYPNEDRVNMTNGVVRIETADAYQRRMAKRNAPPKRKL